MNNLAGEQQVSTTPDKFAYHRHLERIALDDVEFLKRKDRSYGASWKESGRSAWFMVKRMIDRLTVMMARPKEPVTFRLENVKNLASDVADAVHSTNVSETGMYKSRLGGGVPEAMAEHLQYLLGCHTSEDILEKLMEEARADGNLTGPDGTVLAVCRDLRRYLLLVEAEILERVVGDGPVVWTSKSEERRVPRYEDAPTNERKIGAPWIVDAAWKQRSTMSQAMFDKWFSSGRGVVGQWSPKESVHSPNAIPPMELEDIYKKASDNETWILDIVRCPPVLRSAYQKFYVELNLKEYSALPPFAKELYKYDSAQEKYVMQDDHLAWSRW